MRYLPLHFDLQGKRVLVVGGGEIARRKIELLLRSGAHITVVAPKICAPLISILQENVHALHHAFYNIDFLENIILVVAATDDKSVNQLVSRDAQSANILVNVVDSPELCSVTFPAIIDRDPLVISVGSAGLAPTLTRFVRELIETTLPERIIMLARYMGSRRKELKRRFTNIKNRRRRAESFMASPGSELAMQGENEKADAYLFSSLQSENSGEVFVVGAGPGDPDLLTLRAVQLMQKADIVLYDNLVSDRVLERVRRDAVMEFVGKRSGYKSITQEGINELLVRLAQEGNRVLRLKGGDPFVFGRGGEEITALIEKKIPFQVVPGITAASGCAAYADIPLTHRELSQSVRFVTGHPKNGEVDLAWKELSHANETVVFYMGLGGLSSICQQLVAHGRNASTPVAVISKGTTPDQRVLRGTLETISGLAARTHIQSPTLIIVGEVVDFSRN